MTDELNQDLTLALSQLKANEAANDAAAKLKEAAKEGKVARIDTGHRTYVCPQYPNGKFLVRAGVLEEAPFQTGVIGLRPAVARRGDVWAKFTSRILTTDDPEIIAFCEGHSGIPEWHVAYHTAAGTNPASCSTPISLCREQGPGIDVWAEMKINQVPTSRRPATISPDIDIDAFMNGDYQRDKRVTKGVGAQVNEAIEANENAVAERADGQRNEHV